MPDSQLGVVPHDPSIQPSIQIKVCASCHAALVDHSVFTPPADPAFCIGCRDRVSFAPHIPQQDHNIFHIDVDDQCPAVLLPASPDYANDCSPPPSPSAGPPTYHRSILPPPVYSNKPSSISPLQVLPQSSSTPPYSAEPPPRKVRSGFSPDPLQDITRLRVRSHGYRSLYPGATFQGTQKSGRNSYDVNVTIVDVDFASSFLCGYLRIRGLTDDWPELTTYFDAEIIGSRYGFLTQNWGATEHEDLIHWSRFPTFKHVRHDAKKPHLTIDDKDRGAVFMRWKERFLVPDHRVQDINGASFAGFYYVCVDFNPPAPSSGRPQQDDFDLASHPPKSENHSRTRRDSTVRRRAPTLAPVAAPVATMSGFYYHQNSEPYQQLSLCHVPERFSSSFEFR